ncbi:MAG: prolyl oligopeptidase family serine peptidase [Pseudomonadota bacterium]
MMRFLLLPMGLAVVSASPSATAQSRANTAAQVAVPDEAWADGQREIALKALQDRETANAQALFDNGWNPFFGFTPIQIFDDKVAAFDWATHSWRRASLDSYLAGSPDWELMFSLSAIPASDQPFMPRPWANLDCEGSFSGRCMIAITQGGFDEIRWLEIDAGNAAIAQDGFDLPVSRTSIAWIDKNTLLVAIGLSDSETAQTGYPLTVRLLRRGEALREAPVIYRANAGVDSVAVASAGSAGSAYAMIVASIGTRPVDTQFVDHLGNAISVEVPVNVEPLGVLGDYALLTLLDNWNRNGNDVSQIWQAGSVVAVNLSEHSPHELVLDSKNGAWGSGSAASTAALFTHDTAYLSVLEAGVRSIFRLSRGDGEWNSKRVLGDGKSVATLVSADPAGSTLLASLESALSSPTLFQLGIGETATEVRSSTSFFQTDGLTITRHFADTQNGGFVPYLRVGPAVDPEADPVPTILHGYGASNVPLMPDYTADVGRMWLERGGAYVYAQVRGGGEYGAGWYNAGHGQNRAVPLQDFIAVAHDLVAKGLASPMSLGADGTSDGGRLVTGAALARPDLFAAVVSRDGAVYPEASTLEGSPVLAEDLAQLATPEGRALADQYWPDRVFEPARGCAPILFTTWRGDQRVAATQSRALADRLQRSGCDALLLERKGGDHGTIDVELIASVYAYFRARLDAK